MEGEWNVCALDQIKANQDSAIAIGPFGSRMRSDRYVASGVPVIRGNNISDTRALVGDFVFVSKETADELRSSNVFPGDLVFPHRGAIGQVGIVPEGMQPRYVLSTSLMKLSCNRDLVDPLFVFYFFRSGQGRHSLLQHASTVGTPGIGQPLASLRSITLPVPPLQEQGAIAHILGTLDAKIELNREMTETLEAIARTLFKSWFVDFDPVRAKAEGRDPGLPKEIADLLPDRFEDSELGEIPAGWEVKSLDAIADYQNGLALQKYRPAEGNRRLPVVKIAQLRSGEPNSGEWATATIKPECIIDDGDIVFSWSGSLLLKIWCGGRAALNQHLFKVTSHWFPKWFYLHCTLSHLPEFRRIAAGKATTMGHIKRHHLQDARCVVPEKRVLAGVDDIFTGLLERTVSSNVESRTLAAMRVTLLPKLISGELRVKDPERSVAAATLTPEAVA
ncbi:MAG: restriction endonuclease subunit S [Gemmatimonadota bacterium]